MKKQKDEIFGNVKFMDSARNKFDEAHMMTLSQIIDKCKILMKKKCR